LQKYCDNASDFSIVKNALKTRHFSLSQFFIFFIFIFTKKKTMGLFSAAAVAIVGGAALAVGAGPAVVGLLGISETGVIAGGVAAGAQAYVGNVAAGSILAKLTSIAMLSPTP
jgi:hypothetical protein